MSTTEIWDNILKDNVEKDDRVWQEYVDKAAVFDERMVDEWNKIVDVLLVYVALFISILTSFIGSTISQFQRNPADITNDLLVAIYNQQVAQSNNISIPPVNPTSYFNLSQADYDAAVTQNALLYISLSLSIVVSVISLVAKLWLVRYSRQVFSVGSPYDRAMKRQEAYNGVLVWNLGGVINMLPVILLIALLLFGLYVYKSVLAIHASIGHAIGALLGLGMMFIVSTSFVAAFISGCPFRFAFSDVVRISFEMFHTISKWILCERLRWLRIGALTFLWVASVSAVVYATLMIAPTWLIAFLALTAFPIICSTQQEVVHKPQKYKISLLAIWVFFFFSLPIILIFFFTYQTVISLYIIGVLDLVFGCWMFSKMSKSMADTGEIDAIAWLLITIPPQHPATFFKKAGQMTGVDSIGRPYRPRLLETLMPLLSPLITSYHAPEHHTSDTHSPQSDGVLNGRTLTSLTLVNDDMVPIDKDSHSKNLEIYIACLARLSEFTDYEGTFWCLREDAMQHPKLERPLRDKLVELANSQRHSRVVRRTATKVLNNYKLDIEGNPLRSPTTSVLERVATFPRNAATSMSNDNDGLYSQEKGPPDPATRVESEEIEDVKNEFGDEKIEG